MLNLRFSPPLNCCWATIIGLLDQKALLSHPFSQICSLLRGGIAERGGVRVGHRIIEINNQSVVAVPHEKIVNLLATSVGEVIKCSFPSAYYVDSWRSRPSGDCGRKLTLISFVSVFRRSWWKPCRHRCSDCWPDRKIQFIFKFSSHTHTRNTTHSYTQLNR